MDELGPENLSSVPLDVNPRRRPPEPHARPPKNREGQTYFFRKKVGLTLSCELESFREVPVGDDPVEIPIDGVLDLHTFSPKEVKDLVPEYIGECLRRGITEIRIIHGKGTGTLKTIVHSVLKKDPRVAGFKDAELGSGGWGATTASLKP
jgi:hypothetical protein